MWFKNKKGLSIIEVLVATGIMAILMAGFASMMLNQNKETRAVAEILSAQDLMKSMIGSLAKGDVCHYILSTRSFNASQVVAGNPFTINIDNQPIYSSVAASGTPGPVLIRKGDKASVYTSSLVVESILFEVTSGTINGAQGNFQGRWIVNFDGSKSVRKLRPLSISAVITANTTDPTSAGTISCLGSGGSIGSGDQNFLAKWVTDAEIKESSVYEDPVTRNIGVGTITPTAPLSVSGAVRFGQTNAVCNATTEGQQRYNSTSKIMEFCNGTRWGVGGIADCTRIMNVTDTGVSIATCPSGRFITGGGCSGFHPGNNSVPEFHLNRWYCSNTSAYQGGVSYAICCKLTN